MGFPLAEFMDGCFLRRAPWNLSVNSDVPFVFSSDSTCYTDTRYFARLEEGSESKNPALAVEVSVRVSSPSPAVSCC